jgi:hypothetical protein
MTEQQEAGLARAILDLGEERLGELLSQLMSNELFVNAMQNALSSSLSAKRVVDKNVMRALSMINVPTLDDVEELREKLNALDDVMAEVYQRVQELHAVADSRAAETTPEQAEPPATKKQRRKKKSAD